MDYYGIGTSSPRLNKRHMTWNYPHLKLWYIPPGSPFKCKHRQKGQCRSFDIDKKILEEENIECNKE